MDNLYCHTKQIVGNLHFAHLELGDATNNSLYKCNRYNEIEDTIRGGSYSRVKVNPGKTNVTQGRTQSFEIH